MSRHVLIAGLYHETHTFLAGCTRLDDFHVRRGEALLSAAGDASPLGGVLDFAGEAGWTVLPAGDMRAMPGPLVEDAVVDQFWQSVENTLDAGPVPEGVLLVMHGAMVSTSCDDVEGEILQRLWHACGNGTIPICVVLDLHANLSPRMVRYAHALVAYRENPHIDARDAAVDAARLLDNLMRGRQRAQTVARTARVMWPPTGTATADEPMASLEAAAREIERRNPAILAVNVLAGFAFADTPYTGVSLCATTVGDPGDAGRAVARLARLARRERARGERLERSPADVMAHVRRCGTGPIVVAEPSDNIGAGASGGGTGFLRVLLEHGAGDALVALNDPVAVGSVSRMRPGETAVVRLGTKDTPLEPDPLELSVELVSTSDGRFTLEDPRSHLASIVGNRIDMGPCAVVRRQGIRILLTSRKTPPFDLGQWRSQGIEPTDALVVGVKAAVAHRRAYDPIAVAHDTIATPGTCSSDLRTFPYRRVPRPIFPLDPEWLGVRG
jgi:microcystin degradation protein MlrC